MSMNEPIVRKPLRLWPGVALAVLLVVVRFLPIVVDEIMPIAMMGAVVGGAGDSRVVAVLQPRALVRAAGRRRADDRRAVRDVAPRPRVDCRAARWGFVLRLGDPHPGRRPGGVARREPLASPPEPGALSIVAAILLACGVWTLVRTEGVTSDVVGSDFRWRWTPTPEQRLLAQAADNLPTPAACRDGGDSEGTVAPEVTGSPELAATPTAAKARRLRRARRPVAMRPHQSTRREPSLAPWPSPDGPAFADPIATASFAASGSRPTGRRRRRSRCGAGRSGRAGRRSRSTAIVLYTQEQRGDDEMVAATR